MPAVASQMQQDIDRVLKRVDHSVQEFSNHWQRAKVEAASRDIHSQREKLRKLSNTLQQHRSQLQAILSKGGVRKAQKEKLEVSRRSLDRELENFQTLEHELKEKENAAPSNDNSPASATGEVEMVASKIEAQAPVGQDDIKVQCDQLLRDPADDSDMLEELVCKICQVHVVGCCPKLACCSHLFCGDCIAKWFEVQPRSLSWAQRAQSGGLVPCPVCKEPLHAERDLYHVCPTGKSESALLWRLLSGVKIMCANNPKCRADGQCNWTGEYGTYQKHIQSCANVPLDDAILPVRVPAEPRAKSSPVDEPGVCCQEAQAPSIHPRETSEDKHVHDVNNTPMPDDSTEAVNISEASIDIEERTDSPLQPQPAAQQKLAEPAPVMRAARVFTAGDPSQLNIKVGELIQVLNAHPSGWTYGRKVSQDQEAIAAGESNGWFPNWVVA